MLNMRLKHFPISFFSVILGLAGFSIALQKFVLLFDLNSLISTSFVLLSSFLFLLISLIYFSKLVKFKNSVIDELNHPIKINFFPTFSISLLLLSVAYLEINMTVSKVLWIFGAIFHLILTFKIVSSWMHKTNFEVKHMNPSWFIPAVGNILVPISGVNFVHHDILWFFFSIGFVFWIILLILFFNRMFFHNPIHEKLMPTLFILIAPPSIGFISYYKLTHVLDSFAKILYFFSLFCGLLLLSQVRLFSKIKFYLSWWAYSFPIASLSISSFLMFSITKIAFYKYISLLLLFILFSLIIFLSSKTLKAIIHKKICIEEEE